jgi:hypothetical protein
MGHFWCFWAIEEMKKACNLLIYRLLLIFDGFICGEIGF